jgi:hypothetical protein
VVVPQVSGTEKASFGGTVSTYHCHPGVLATPFMYSVMTPARRPPKAPDINEAE